MNGVSGRLQLRPLQRSMILASLRSPDSGVYIIQNVCDLEEKPEVALLRHAWDTVAGRYPALRRSIEFQGPDPVALALLDTCNVEWQEVHERDPGQFLQRDRERGFDFHQGIPMRFAVIATPNGSAKLVWTSHHALLDGRSYAIVWREWLAAYDLLAQGREMQAVDDPVAEAFPAGPGPETAETYWRRCYDGISQSTGYIQDRLNGPEPGEQRFARESAVLSVDVTERLLGLAQEFGVSVNNLVQGAWALLLSRYSGQPSVVFGITRAGRSAATADQVGFFINTVPLRVDVSPEKPLVEWLRRLRASTQELREFEQTPVDWISKWSGLPPGTPPFESVLVYEHEPPGVAMRVLGGAWARRNLHRFQRTDSAVTLAAHGGPVLSVDLVFDTRLFSRNTMRAAADHLATLLQSFLDRPDSRLSQVNMLTAADRRLTTELNQAAVARFPQDLCAHQLFEQQARRTPAKAALEFPGGSVSYEELNQRANRLAGHFRAEGAGLEDLVAIAMKPSVETIVAILAVLKAGAAFLPLDPHLPAERRRSMLADANPKLSLPEDLPSPASLAQRSSDNLPNIATQANAAYAIYTSGSTGAPKAVVALHRGLVNHTLEACALYGVTEKDRRLQFASVGTDFFIAEVFNYLSSGATLVLGWNRGGTVRDFLRYLDEKGITITGVPSAWWHEWVAAMEHGELPAPRSLRAVIIGMEKANPTALRSWNRSIEGKIRLFNAYGPTETSLTATVYEAGTSAWEGDFFVPIGRPLANTRVYVLSHDGSQLPVGIAGELYIGGAGVARGYLSSPEQTARRFVKDPFSEDPESRLYATGDIVFLLPDGNLVFLGRADRQVKIRGHRVELEEIEVALAAHPAIRQCAVILGGTENQRVLAAFYTLQEGLAPSPPELRTYLARTLPEHMIPAVFEPLADMPMTPSGKVDRQTLELREVHPAPKPAHPLSPAEERLAAIWMEALGVQPVSPDDHFFDLGGDSLRATILFTILETTLGRPVPSDTLLRAPTLSRMAAVIEQMEAHGEESAVIALRTGTRIPFCCLPGAEESPYYFWGLARSLGKDQPFHLVRDPRRMRDRGVYTVEESAQYLLNRLREFQPSGPYILGGHCYGGIVAFEMARQLISQGQNVALVVLLDVATPGYPKVFRHWKEYLRHTAQFVIRHPRAVFKEAGTHVRFLGKLFLRRLSTSAWRVAMSAGLKGSRPPEVRQPTQTNRQAGFSYRPRTLACDVIHYLSDIPGMSTRILPDSRLGWGEFVTGRYKTCRTPGNAVTLCQEPNVGELGANLRTVLDEWNR